MKKLIFQINVPFYSKNNPDQMPYSYDQDMYAVSNRQAKEYAAKCSADYYMLTDPNEFAPAAGKHLDYQKMKMYDLMDYDFILYMDSDYIIKSHAPNLFDICGNHFSAALDQGRGVVDKSKELGIPHNRYFNAGLMFVPKWVLERTKDSVKEYLKYEYSLQGQGLLNKMFYEHDVEINELNYMEWNPVKRTFGTYADHYSGNKKDRWGTVSY